MTSPDLRERLPMWVVYDHPLDFPNAYLARLWLTLPKAEATSQYMACADLEPLRDQLASMGFVKLDRHDSDDAKIIETWV